MSAVSAGVKIPERKLKSFERWLHQYGGEILPTKSKHEAIRFKSQYGTGVMYKLDDGLFSFGSEISKQAFSCFSNGTPWSGVPKLPRQRKTNKTIRVILSRDGGECFYCGRNMIGSDISIEHLVNITHGGTNRLDNKVLAHVRCNFDAGCLSLVDKIHLRDRMRGVI